MNEYVVDFTVTGQSGHEYQSSMNILATCQDMAQVIFYDGLAQEYPEDQFRLTDAGTYELNKENPEIGPGIYDEWD